MTKEQSPKMRFTFLNTEQSVNHAQVSADAAKAPPSLLPGSDGGQKLQFPSRDVLLPGGATSRAAHVAALQRAVGNRQVAQLLEGLAVVKERGPTRAPGVAVGYGGPSFHGRTEGAFDGGKKAIVDLKTSRATGCNCPAGQPCLSAVAKLVVTYTVKVTITMPPMPSGLSECKRNRVSAFFSRELRRHEEEHKRRLETYNGTSRRAAAGRTV